MESNVSRGCSSVVVLECERSMVPASTTAYPGGRLDAGGRVRPATPANDGITGFDPVRLQRPLWI